MHNRLRNFGLIALGALAGVLVSLNFPAVADRAPRAGVKPGDLIIKLDETPVKGMSLNDAVKRMRGKPNTSITLTISRKGESAPIVVTLTRSVIRVQSVKSKVIEPGYGWVRVSQFQEATTENMVKQLTQMFKENPNLKGLVLDLRNDPGGLLHGAVATTARYYTPGGRSIQALGIKPDLVVEDPTDTLTRVREADLTRHLNNAQVKADEPKADAKKPDEKKDPSAAAKIKPQQPVSPAEM